MVVWLGFRLLSSEAPGVRALWSPIARLLFIAQATPSAPPPLFTAARLGTCRQTSGKPPACRHVPSLAVPSVRSGAPPGAQLIGGKPLRDQPLTAVMDNFTDQQVYDMVRYWRQGHNEVKAEFEIVKKEI